MRTGYTEKVNQAILGLRKERVNKFAETLPTVPNQSLEDAMLHEEGCRVVGHIQLHKVPSTTEQQQWHINKLMQTNKDLAMKVSLIHYFRKYTFLKSEQDLIELNHRFSCCPEHLLFDIAPK